MSYMFYQTYVQTLDLSHFTFSSECNVDQMLFTARGDLWRLILGANQTFSANANFQNPTLGSTIPGAGSNYVSGKRWQIVGDGTDHAPTGAKISGADIPSDSRAVTTTYVWEHIEKWRGVNGNSPWYLNPDDGVLTFYQSEDGSPTALAEPVYDNLQNTFGWSFSLIQSVTAIRFDADIAAPVNSSNLFAGLENLTSFDSTNLDTSNVENMSNMFQGLYSLSTLNIGGFNTDKVTDMSGMFSESALNSLDLSHFNTDKVENMAANDFFNGNSPLATNMATGSVALEGLDSSRTYHVTVAQTSDWTTDGESDTIAKSNLKIKYGANDLSTSASSFWSGTSATGTQNIAFNHDTTKNFSIWLNPNAALSTNLLGKQLESELTWTLSDTPE
ncbi:hypothetical protein Pfo_031596 [Paulownia fortunei]|nr:hypothetical protein Pfo_031596 [Paulownia fortunei]